MTERVYDTRPRGQILEAAHFDPYREMPGLQNVQLRELRTLDRFFRFAASRGIGAPSVDAFLSFVADDRSTRRLDDLRTVLDHLLPPNTPVLLAIRDAIRLKRPRSRSCDRRPREVLRHDPVLAPYRDLPAFDEVAIEDLRVMARFLDFCEEKGISVPEEADYLAFVGDVASSRRLRSLKSAFQAFLPGSPALHVVLESAISAKSPDRPSKAGTMPRPAAKRRVDLDDLPSDWQAVLDDLRLGAVPVHARAPAASVIDSMQDVLREYAKVQIDAGAPVEISLDGVRRYEAARAEYSAQRSDPDYADQGNRPATQHTVIQRLRVFGAALGLDPRLLQDLRIHESALRRRMSSSVPLKFGKFDSLPSLTEVWQRATDLLAHSHDVSRNQTRCRLINEAGILALWTLLPLRLQDGQLRWGRDIVHDGSVYWVDIETHKELEPLRGALHRALTPFLEPLLLRGVDPAYLVTMRDRAIASSEPVFRDVAGRMLAKGYPSTVWRTHTGTGAHISRTRIRTELGQLGPEGVSAALALTAQRDARSQRFYQGKAVAAAQRRAGQNMIDDLLGECFEE